MKVFLDNEKKDPQQKKKPSRAICGTYRQVLLLVTFPVHETQWPSAWVEGLHQFTASIKDYLELRVVFLFERGELASKFDMGRKHLPVVSQNCCWILQSH